MTVSMSVLEKLSDLNQGQAPLFLSWSHDSPCFGEVYTNFGVMFSVMKVNERKGFCYSRRFQHRAYYILLIG